MKLREEFTIEQRPEDVWKFLQQAELVAACMPGMEAIDVIDEDHVQVRVSQRVGPMSATFQATVSVLERVDGESIRFEAVGKSVRGAAGSMRSLNTVTLRPSDAGTVVVVDGDVVLAGALGSVGQKVVARQASKVTGQFVANLMSGMTAGPPRGVATEGRARSSTGTEGRVAALSHGGGQDRLAAVPDRERVDVLRWWLVADTVVRVASLLALGLMVRRVLRVIERVAR